MRRPSFFRLSLLLFVFILVLSPKLLNAQALNEPKADAEENLNYDIRLLESYKLPDVSEVAIVVRDNGHVLGQEFIVELRQSMVDRFTGKLLPLRGWPVLDSYSVCNLDPSSIKLNTQGTAVAIKIKNADIQTYYSEISEGRTPSSVTCKKATQILKFSMPVSKSD